MKTHCINLTLAVAITAACASLAKPALAAEPVADATFEERVAPKDDWSLIVTPYLWAASLSGDVGVFGVQPITLDLSFGDILDGLKFGGMVTGELHNGTWGVFGDLIYLNAEANPSISRVVLGAPQTLSASVNVESLTATLMGEYRLPLADPIQIDLMAGARLWSVDTDIEASLTRRGPRIAEFSGSDGDTWVDPMIGVKMRIDTTTPFYLTAWGMVGGFGAGSDFSWDVMAGAGYDWNDRVSSTFGYRALGVDYASDGFVFNEQQRGFFLGAKIRF